MLAAALPAGAALLYLVLQPPLDAFGRALLIAAALETLIILALAWRLGTSFLLPSQQAAVTVQQRTAGGDLSTHEPPERPRDDDDFSRLAHEVDLMAEALSRRDQALTETRDRAQAYLDVVGVMVLVLNAKGNIALANHKACEVLGCRLPHECVGGNWFDTWIPIEARDQARALFAEKLAGAPTPIDSHESLVLTASGQRRLIAWHVSPLAGKDGRVIGLLCAGGDITEQRRIEQALLESRNRYQTLVENIPGVVYRCAIAYPWRMVFINHQIEQITGIATERFLDHSVRYGELIHPDDLEAFRSEEHTSELQSH